MSDHPPAAPAPAWRQRLDTREAAQVDHARAYAAQYHIAGTPGHGHFLLIAKLADLLDAADAREAVRPC